MHLQPRHPPALRRRKVRAYAGEISRLQADGYTCDEIRQALAEAGVLVSNSTVQREGARARQRSTPAPAATVTSISSLAPVVEAQSTPAALPRGRHAERRPLPNAAVSPASPNSAIALPGRATAEEFMRGQPTNPLHLKELAP